MRSGDRIPAVVEAKNLYCAHGWQYVIRDVSFQVQRGEIAVVVGVNGVGKSTLLAAIAGALSAVKGSVSVCGNVRRSSPESERAARQRTIFLPDDPWFPRTMLVREYLGSAAELFNLPKAEALDRIDSLLNLFALTDSGRQSLFSLSSGQRKKVGLCVALLPDRELLLLDEPFSGGLDPAGIAALQRVLTHRARHNGQTIVMTTPVAEIVSELADRLLILKSGELTGNFSRSELKQHCQDEVISANTLNALIFPDVAARIDQYLAESTGQFTSSGSSWSGTR